MLGLNKSEITKKIKFRYHEDAFINQNKELGIVADRIADAVAEVIEKIIKK